MKQKAQWLSQVRMRSKTADETSTPKGSPGSLSMRTRRGRAAPARLTMTLRSSASVNCWKSMTSRGSCPLSESSSSPTARPARAAGDASVTEVTVGADMGHRLVAGGGGAGQGVHWGAEIVALIEILDEPRLRRLPAEQLAGQRARRRTVHPEEMGQVPEVRGVLGR